MSALLTTIYRYRLVTWSAAILICLITAFTADLDLPPEIRQPQVTLVKLAFAAAGVTLAVFPFGPRLLGVPDARRVDPPVRGTWMAINSPSSTVPSHGVRAGGQTYAMDLVTWPMRHPGDPLTDDPAQGFRRPEAFPSFGRPVLAPVDGTVVRASGWRRDHRSRESRVARLYLVLEGQIRSFGGPGWVLGNHVVIRAGDGSYALVAHLRSGTLRVALGDRVRAGQQIGECGNSGNSTEPHVHVQLMDRPSAWTAAGVPVEFRSVEVTRPDPADLPEGFAPDTPDRDARFEGVPANGELLVTAEVTAKG